MSQWLVRLTFIVMFFKIIEILLPTGSYRKYVSLIAGIITTVIIISPLVQIFKGKESFAAIQLNIEDSNSQELYSLNNQYIVERQNKQIIDIYKKRVNDYITERISSDNNVIINNIDVDINDDEKSKDYGKIKYLTIYMQYEQTSKDEFYKIHIPKIQINREKEDFTKSKHHNTEVEQRILKTISNELQINEKNIELIFGE